MVDDLLDGRVTSFRREQGFGVITLDDGRDVKFDASNCTMVPEEGAAVRLRVGPARWGGGVKALHVEPRGSSKLVVPEAPPTLDQQIAALQREHLVSALSERAMAEILAQAFGGRAQAASLVRVIDAYYARDPRRAVADGYLRAARGDSGDILARISALLPGVALPRELSRIDGRQRQHAVESLDDIVLMVNRALRAAGDLRRLYPLQTDGDWHAYLALTTDRAKRLDGVLPFEVAPSLIE